MLSVCYQLFSATATTAGLERIFSSYGLVHSKLRNKLGNKKAAKLTFLFKHLNQPEDKQDKITPNKEIMTSGAISHAKLQSNHHHQ